MYVPEERNANQRKSKTITLQNFESTNKRKSNRLKGTKLSFRHAFGEKHPLNFKRRTRARQGIMMYV